MPDTYIRVSDVRRAAQRLESVFDEPKAQELIAACMATIHDAANGKTSKSLATTALFSMLMDGHAGKIALLIAYAEMSHIINGPRVTPPADWQPGTDAITEND